eukprot:gene393-3739_t
MFSRYVEQEDEDGADGWVGARNVGYQSLKKASRDREAKLASSIHKKRWSIQKTQARPGDQHLVLVAAAHAHAHGSTSRYCHADTSKRPPPLHVSVSHQ